MIDEAKLDYLELSQKGMHPKDVSYIATAEFNLDLIRLARLGLWAEKYGIVATKLGLDNTSNDFCSHNGDSLICSWCAPFREALAALPKESSLISPQAPDAKAPSAQE